MLVSCLLCWISFLRGTHRSWAWRKWHLKRDQYSCVLSLKIQRDQVHEALSSSFKGSPTGLHQEQSMLSKHYKAIGVVKEPRWFPSSEICLFTSMNTSGWVPPCFLGTSLNFKLLGLRCLSSCEIWVLGLASPSLKLLEYILYLLGYGGRKWSFVKYTCCDKFFKMQKLQTLPSAFKCLFSKENTLTCSKSSSFCLLVFVHVT